MTDHNTVSEHDDNSRLKNWVPAWLPTFGFVSDPSEWKRIPKGIKCMSKIPTVGMGGIFMWSPPYFAPKGLRSMGQWPSDVAGSVDDLRSRLVSCANRDLVGKVLLVRTVISNKRAAFTPPVMIFTPVQSAADEVTTTEQRAIWAFAYVSGYNTYNQKHELVYDSIDGIHTTNCSLGKCVFQEQLPTDLKKVYLAEDNEHAAPYSLRTLAEACAAARPMDSRQAPTCYSAPPSEL